MSEPQNPFGLGYETRLIAGLLRDRFFLHSFLPLYKPEYCISEVNKVVYTIICEFEKQFRRGPDQVELEVVLLEHFAAEYPADKAAQEFNLYSNEIKQYWRFTASELEFVIVTALKYAQQRACEIGVLECSRLIGTEKAHLMPDILHNALNVGTRLTSFGTEYFTELRQRAFKRYSQPRETNRIPFFIPKLDATVGGVGYRENGSGSPEMFMVGGGAGVGKSRFLGHMVKVAISLGLPGVVFSSENSEDLWAERMDMGLSLLDTKGLYDPNNFDHLQRRVEMFAKQGAKFWIKKFPSQSTTIRETLSIARLIESTLGVDLKWVAWDYTGEFKAENGKQERRDQMAEIVRAQVAAKDELECAGLGAFQLNRTGMTAEMANLTDAAEDITVARVADTVGILAQTEEEEKKDPPELRLCLRKVRAQDRNLHVLLEDHRKIMLLKQHPSEVMEQSGWEV